MNAPDVSRGGYRFADLRQMRIVSTRSDLHHKQRHLGFPKPVKLGPGARGGALFLKSEVDQWLVERARLRESAA